MKESKIINLTQHDVNFINGETVIKTFKPSGTVARVSVELAATGTIFNIGGVEYSAKAATYGNVENMPEMGKADFFIVSRMVANAMKEDGEDTSYLLIPSGLVRDENGRIIGCTGFETV